MNKSKKENILQDITNIINFLNTVPVAGQVNCFNMSNSIFTLQAIHKAISEESVDEESGGDKSK